MPDDKSNPKDSKRNLPSWMSSRQKGGGGESSKGNKSSDDSNEPQSNTNHYKKETKSNEKSFSKLMEGVVFVLSGFVNPERGTLRSQALEMGAEFKQDWNSDCTLLVCAFANTPKFRQVESDGGTIISKGWISECHKQRQLVAIEPYFLHAGKPWRKTLTRGAKRDLETTPTSQPKKQAKESSNPKASAAASSKDGSPNSVKERLAPSKVKRWAMDDLNKTISWLEGQDETPEPSEVKKIAVEGILTCLQDAIDSLEQNQDIKQATEQWRFIPRVVEELVRIEDTRNNNSSFSSEDLCLQAMNCKQIYEMEFDSFLGETTEREKEQKTAERSMNGETTDVKSKDAAYESMNGETTDVKSKDAAYDSDSTIEMTEEEIDYAYKTVASKICR
ncbi:hypothetical protein MKX03_016553 [Papaver bracteatum]|nr:hypothetical protein MKX03_016553 [Papaver bracteatum]